MKIKALFVSDIHLGSKGCNDIYFLETLKLYKPEKLFLVGDFIDGWLLRKRHYWPQTHTNVVQKILKLSKKGTQVVYITGNHDDFLRLYEDLNFGQINITDEFIYNDYYIVHGDKYDGVVKLHWLGKLGAYGYELAIGIDNFLKKIGFKISLSSYLKRKVKDAVKFITNFENELIRQAKLRGCKGVICGHIHRPKDVFTKDSIHYLNCGDWIENNSYIIQKLDGSFELCRYQS